MPGLAHSLVRWTSATAIIAAYVLAAGMAHFAALSFAARYRLLGGPTRVSTLLATAITDQLFNVVSILMLAAILMCVANLWTQWVTSAGYAKILSFCFVAHAPMALWAMGAYWWTARRLSHVTVPSGESNPRLAAARALVGFSQEIIGLRLGAYCITLTIIGYCLARASDLGLKRAMIVAYGSGACLFILGRLLSLLG